MRGAVVTGRIAATRISRKPQVLGSESALVVGAHRRLLKSLWPLLEKIRPDFLIDERGFLRNQNPHGGSGGPRPSESSFDGVAAARPTDGSFDGAAAARPPGGLARGRDAATTF